MTSNWFKAEWSAPVITSTAALGRYYLYVRSGKGQLLIEAANKYIIAPERPQEFLQSLQRAISAAKNTGGVR